MIKQLLYILTKGNMEITLGGDLKTLLSIKKKLSKPHHFLSVGYDDQETKIKAEDVKKLEYQYYDEPPK